MNGIPIVTTTSTLASIMTGTAAAITVRTEAIIGVAGMGGMEAITTGRMPGVTMTGIAANITTFTAVSTIIRLLTDP